MSRRSALALRGTASATFPAQMTAPTTAAAGSASPPKMATDIPAPASRNPDGAMMARATAGVFMRSGRRSIATQTPVLLAPAPAFGGRREEKLLVALKIAYHVGEDVFDGAGIAGVVGGGVGGFGHLAQRAEVGVAAVADSEQAHGRG